MLDRNLESRISTKDDIMLHEYLTEINWGSIERLLAISPFDIEYNEVEENCKFSIEENPVDVNMQIENDLD